MAQAYISNLKLQEEMQTKGINIINCCMCGEVNLHKTTPISEKELPIVCVGCEEEIYPNDCTDLFYPKN